MKSNLIVKLAILGALLVPGFAGAVSLHPDTGLKTDGLVCGLIGNINSPYGQVEQPEGSDYSIRVDCDMDQSPEDLAQEPIMVIENIDNYYASLIRRYNDGSVRNAKKLFDPAARTKLPYVCLQETKITFDPCEAKKAEGLSATTPKAHIRRFEHMSAYPKTIKAWAKKEASANPAN